VYKWEERALGSGKRVKNVGFVTARKDLARAIPISPSGWAHWGGTRRKGNGPFLGEQRKKVYQSFKPEYSLNVVPPYPRKNEKGEKKESCRMRKSAGGFFG